MEGRSQNRKRVKKIGYTDDTFSNYVKTQILRAELLTAKQCEYYKGIREKTADAVKTFHQVITDSEELDSLFSSLESYVINYIHETVGTDAQARYNQGKLLFEITTMFTPTKGPSFITNLKNALKALPKITSKISLKNAVAKLKTIPKVDYNRRIKEFTDNPSEFVKFLKTLLKTPAIDLSTLLKYKEFIPTGIHKTNLKLVDFTKVEIPVGDTRLKDLYQTLDNIKHFGDDGSLTEKALELWGKQAGYKVGDGKHNAIIPNGDPVNGFDLVLYKGDIKKPTEILIFESKKSTSINLSGPNSSSGLPSQMSFSYVRYISNKYLLGSGGEKKKLADAILNMPHGSIDKFVFTVIDGDIYILKLDSTY